MYQGAIAADRLLHAAESGQDVAKGLRTAVASGFEWCFVITGGMALFLPAILWLGESELQNETRIPWYFWASTIVSSPHVYSTYVRQCRKTREGKVNWLWGAPAYIACVLLLAAASAAGYFVETITAVNVWQSFHYLRQTYGVGCLYGRQDSFDDRDRKWRWCGSWSDVIT